MTTLNKAQERFWIASVAAQLRNLRLWDDRQETAPRHPAARDPLLRAKRSLRLPPELEPAIRLTRSDLRDSIR